MLPKKQRLNRGLFNETLTDGRRYTAAYLSLSLLRKATNSRQFAFAVSKKTARLAVTRNAMRRRGSAALATFMPQIPPATLGVFFFKKGSERLSLEELTQEIHTLLVRARIL